LIIKKGKLVTFVLLFAISFSTLHAYAIDFLDTNQCSASEYVEEIANESTHHDYKSGDVCSVHYLFHMAFIIPVYKNFISVISRKDKPLSTQSSYTYNNLENFLKPPIL